MFNKEWLWFFLFALIASLVGSELDFSYTVTALSVGGNSSIFTHFATFNRIKFGLPCVVSPLLLGSGCCFMHVMLLLLNSIDMVFLFTVIGYFFRVVSVTTFSIIGSYSFLKLFVTHTKGTNFKFLLAPIAFSRSYSILSPLKKWGSIDQFSV